MKKPNSRSPERGATLITVIIVVTVLAAMSASLLSLSVSSVREVDSTQDSARALYLADAGLSEAVALIQASQANVNIEVPASLGDPEDPRHMKGGGYWVDIQDNGNETTTLTSHGQAGQELRAVELVLAFPSGSIYANALFAGNSSGDPTYALELSGNGGQADEVNGDIYSMENVSIEGDATVSGTIRAGGTITGADGETGVTQPIPNIGAMNYEVNNDVDVLSEFNTGGANYVRDDAGGRAWQLPESNPAHIFRVNPSDRRSECNSTVKHDFFLEDPYEPVNADSSSDGSNTYPITLSGQAGNPGENGSGKVYFIDGNMWVHNYRTFSFGLEHADGEESLVTFIVKGNVYFSDNLFLENSDTDGVAFVAIVDDAVEDSGNIYFGDPEFGTLEYMQAYMYAENNFYDYNLDAQGSARVTVVGNMTAGNHVSIERDFGDQHSKLTVEFDSRVWDGSITLPGLPGSSAGGDSYVILSWREVALQ